jgi:hypothetical protein
LAYGFLAAVSLAALAMLLHGCAMSPTKVATIAGHTLAETSSTYRRVNGVAVEGCTRAEPGRFPTPVCKAWADFSAVAVPTLDRLEGAYLAGTNPSGPDWEAFLVELAELGGRIFALAFPADGGAR